MDCKEFMADLGDYLDGDVASAVRAQLEAHLSHCQTCRVVYDSVRKTVTVLTDCGSFELSDAASKPITEEIMARIRSQRRSS